MSQCTMILKTLCFHIVPQETKHILSVSLDIILSVSLDIGRNTRVYQKVLRLDL